MTYEEFTERATREITRQDYHDYIEPVYVGMENLDKDFCATMYDVLGITIFKASRDYCNAISEQRDKVILMQNKLLEERERLKEML